MAPAGQSPHGCRSIGIMNQQQLEDSRRREEGDARLVLEAEGAWRCMWQEGTRLRPGQRRSAWPAPRRGTTEQVVRSFLQDHDAPGEGSAHFRLTRRDGDEEIDLVVRVVWKQVGGQDVIWNFTLVAPFDLWTQSRAKGKRDHRSGYALTHHRRICAA